MVSAYRLHSPSGELRVDMFPSIRPSFDSFGEQCKEYPAVPLICRVSSKRPRSKCERDGLQLNCIGQQGMLMMCLGTNAIYV